MSDLGRAIGDDFEMLLWIAGAASVVALGLLGILVVYYVTTSDLQSDAIERGYAQHRPKSGEWAWKGECDE